MILTSDVLLCNVGAPWRMTIKESINTMGLYSGALVVRNRLWLCSLVSATVYPLASLYL